MNSDPEYSFMSVSRFRSYLIYVIFFYLSTSFSFAQNSNNADSIEKLLKIYKNDSSKDSVCYSLFNQIFWTYRDIDFEKASEIGNSAIEYAEKNKNIEQLNFWYSVMAHFYVDYELYSFSLEINRKRKLNYSPEYGENFWWNVNIGNIYIADNNYEKGIYNLNEALKGFIKQREKGDKYAYYGIYYCYLNLGNAYIKAEQYDSSLWYYQSAIKAIEPDSLYYFNKIEPTVGLLNVYLTKGNTDSAELYLNKATEYEQAAKIKILTPLIMEKTGDFYAVKKQFDLALIYYDSSEYSAYHYRNTKNISRIYEKRAQIYVKNRELAKAIEQYQKGMLYADSTNNLKRLIEYSKKVSGLYYELKNYDLAFRHLSNYIQYKDSMEKLNLKVLLHKYEREDEEFKSSSLEHALSIEKTETGYYRSLIVISFVAVTFLIIMLFYIIRSRKKLQIQNDKIIEHKNTIAAQYEEIYQQNDLLNTYKNDLEILVKEKTIHLENALKKAEESDRLKTAFLTNMSHEIRTPMNAVLGFSSLLSDSKLDLKTRTKYTEILIKSTEQLHKIINDIIELSKIESGEIVINETYFEVDVLFEELKLFFAKQLFDYKKNHIEIEYLNKLSNKDIMIVADRKIIKQVMINLLDNSIKFTNKGSILFGCREIDENKIQFFVKDTGVGIAESDFSTIFKRFHQLENHHKTKHKGVGLGLAISKSLVEKLGGNLTVESEQGKGSHFYFTIPYMTEKKGKN